jgi:hypothetical protein
MADLEKAITGGCHDLERTYTRRRLGTLVTLRHRSYVSFLAASIFGDFFGDGDGQESKAQLVQEWEMLSLNSALLLSVSASGLFTVPSTEQSGGNPRGRMLALNADADTFMWIRQLATMAFCVSTFCYLTSCISAAFFVQFANSVSGDAAVVRCVLGRAENIPRLYFRLGCAQQRLNPLCAAVTAGLRFTRPPGIGSHLLQT